MAGEHLAISNYDDLNASEIATKINRLANQPDLTIDWQAILDHENSRPEPRSSIVEKVEVLLGLRAPRTSAENEDQQNVNADVQQDAADGKSTQIKPGGGGAGGVSGATSGAASPAPGDGGADTAGTGGETTSGTGGAGAAKAPGGTAKS